MVTTEDIDTILTSEDLANYLIDDLERVGGDPRISIKTGENEVILTSDGFVRGLSISVNTFGVWEMYALISHEGDGEYYRTGDKYSTESVMTVLRAVARWMLEARKYRPPSIKYRIALFRKEITEI